MSYPAQLATVYATDEDIAIAAPGDYAVLAPGSQLLVEGDDGVFLAPDRWTLNSATADFSTLQVGHVIRLLHRSAFPGSGQFFAIGASTASSVTLRRINQVDAFGQPPGPIAGLTGVKFVAATLGPQIQSACNSINRQFNIDPNVAWRSPDYLRDIGDLKDATVTRVLLSIYNAANRDSKGDFYIKAQLLKQSLLETEGRIKLRWGPSDNPPRVSSPFTTRCARG